jgi:hypothetical protein
MAKDIMGERHRSAIPHSSFYYPLSKGIATAVISQMEHSDVECNVVIV